MEELADSGRLPALRSLMQEGTVLPAASPPLVGVAYSSEYGGKRPADHGVYFPFQWSAEAQRVRTWQEIGIGKTIFRRVHEAGRRLVVIDPPECFPEPAGDGFIVSGWQFQERVLLAPWSTQAQIRRDLRRRFGGAKKTEETFGQPTAKGLQAIYRVLMEAPERLRLAAEFFLKSDPPDALWISCAGLHLASHQFFDLSLPEVAGLPVEDRRRLEHTIATLFEEYDRVLGRILERLPPGSDRIVFSAKGIGPVIGWVDLLPEMLRRVLGGRVISSPISSLRARVPRVWRERAVRALPDRTARELVARLWSPRADWSRTRAFTLPSDAPGFIRLNLRGRERFGCVAPEEAAALREEIAAGLSTFTDLEGEPCVRKILRPEEIFGEGERLYAFPDLVVFWAPKKTLRGCGVRSPKFGEVLREGDSGTGRSGDHSEDAVTIIAPGSGSVQLPGRKVEPYDIPATLLSALGLPHGDLPGHPLLEPH